MTISMLQVVPQTAIHHLKKEQGQHTKIFDAVLTSDKKDKKSTDLYG